jgi:hypothetical protein
MNESGTACATVLSCHEGQHVSGEIGHVIAARRLVRLAVSAEVKRVHAIAIEEAAGAHG